MSAYVFFVESGVFNCSDCKLGYYCDEDKSWPNSKGPSGIQRKFEIKEIGYISNVCPKPKADPYYLTMYSHYKNSVFPFSGGYLEQPHYYTQIMDILESAQ